MHPPGEVSERNGVLEPEDLEGLTLNELKPIPLRLNRATHQGHSATGQHRRDLFEHCTRDVTVDAFCLLLCARGQRAHVESESLVSEQTKVTFCSHQQRSLAETA